jgi:hypothetical protein
LEGWVLLCFKILVFIALVGNILSFSRHRRVLLLIFAAISPTIIFSLLYVRFNQPLLYVRLCGLALELHCKPAVRSTRSQVGYDLPHCSFAKEESMPTDACQFFYECKNCKAGIETEAWRLLRLLFLWVGEVSA